MAKYKILVVDDEPDIVDTLKFRLESEGYEVVTANNGEEALDKVHNEKPDLVVLDLIMPKKDGMQVCAELRLDSDFKDLPIIMLTAKAQDVDRIEGLGTGADDYITKPFDTAKLFVSIKELLKKNSNP